MTTEALKSNTEEIANIKIKNSELKHENESLTTKFNQLKSNVIELKKHLDTAVFTQIDAKQQKINDTKVQIADANNKISSMIKELEDYEQIQSKQKQMRQKYFSLLNDKMKNENFYLNQEDIIRDLQEKNMKLRERSQIETGRNNKITEEYDKMYILYEEKKKSIQDLQNELTNKINVNKNSVNELNEKNQEIQKLRNTLEMLKNENESQYQNIQKLKSKLKIANEKNKHIMSFIQENSSFNNVMNNVSTTNNNSMLPNNSTSQIIKQHQMNQQRIADEMNVSITNENKDISNLNENEENNMKEIAGLMKSILDE